MTSSYLAYYKLIMFIKKRNSKLIFEDEWDIYRYRQSMFAHDSKLPWDSTLIS